jgi:hypothetical protein
MGHEIQTGAMRDHNPPRNLELPARLEELEITIIRRLSPPTTIGKVKQKGQILNRKHFVIICCMLGLLWACRENHPSSNGNPQADRAAVQTTLKPLQELQYIDPNDVVHRTTRDAQVEIIGLRKMNALRAVRDRVSSGGVESNMTAEGTQAYLEVQSSALAEKARTLLCKEAEKTDTGIESGLRIMRQAGLGKLFIVKDLTKDRTPLAYITINSDGRCGREDE